MTLTRFPSSMRFALLVVGVAAGAIQGGCAAEPPPPPATPAIAATAAVDPPAPWDGPPPAASASASALPAPTTTAARPPSPPPAAPKSTVPSPSSASGGESAETLHALFDEAQRAPAATLRPQGIAGDDPLAKGLRETAKTVAAGMAPDGPLAIGSLQEKQTMQTDVTLAPGRCYAIVGYSKHVRDLDLYLLLVPGIVSAKDSTDDGAPIIGASPRPLCPFARSPVTYKLAVVAEQGAGDVAVQLFSSAR